MTTPLDLFTTPEAPTWVSYLPDGAISVDLEDTTLVLRASHSILKFFQVDITGMCRMTSSARYFKDGVDSSRPN
jgi:hypothetical protein